MKKYTSIENVPKFTEINDTKIKRKREINLLGITIYEKLNFGKHVDILCNKAARQINASFYPVFIPLFPSLNKSLAIYCVVDLQKTLQARLLPTSLFMKCTYSF